NPLNVSFQYLSPISQVLLFALCIGRNPEIVPFGYHLQNDSFLNFTHKFLNEVDTQRIHLIPYQNEKTALADAKAGRICGVLSFPPYYSHAFIDRLAFNVSNRTIAHSTITLRADMTNRIVVDLS